MKNVLVSVIVTTKNEEKNLATCLKSIKKQTYTPIEIIIIDNGSTDNTKNIAKQYTRLVFDQGPERSAQRNYGVIKSNGKYIFILDADMKLSPHVVGECVRVMQKENVGGVIVPEESYGIGFWADVKRLERSFYIGNDFIEAARFFDKQKYLEIGGFDESITGPEDWDFSQRMRDKFGLARINALIFHNEGKLSFRRSVSKKYYYSKRFNSYVQKKNNKKYIKNQMNLFQRYKIFFSQPKKLLKKPILGIGVLILKTSEFISGGVGYLLGANQT